MAVLDLGRVVGPQGPQGATGAQGVRGEQGLPGPNQLTNQTATPLTGVIVGNGSVVGVRSIDSTPTANSTGIPTSGGVKTALDEKAPVYGRGKNLLDNAYFGNPVNQRGNSSYSAMGYTVDRWKAVNFTTIVTITSQDVRLKASTSGASGIIDQYINEPNSLLEKTLTISAWLSTGLETHTFTMPSSYSTGYILAGTRLYVGANADGTVYVRIVHANTWDLYIYAVKLELGTQQTLVHNEGTDAQPVWVLNDIPDYEHELIKCQTSTADSSDTYANRFLVSQPASLSLTYPLISSVLARSASTTRRIVIPVPYGYTSASVTVQSQDITTREFGTSTSSTFAVTSVSASLSNCYLDVTLSGTGLESAMDVIALNNNLIITLS